MPIFLFILWAGSITGLAYQQDVKEQKINEICVQNYKKLDEVKQCKSILMQVDYGNYEKGLKK